MVDCLVLKALIKEFKRISWTVAQNRRVNILHPCTVTESTKFLLDPSGLIEKISDAFVIMYGVEFWYFKKVQIPNIHFEYPRFNQGCNTQTNKSTNFFFSPFQVRKKNFDRFLRSSRLPSFGISKKN
jgi:hypothetical protein